VIKNILNSYMTLSMIILTGIKKNLQINNKYKIMGLLKEKLAVIIEAYFGEGSICVPDKLKVNRGANRYNDWCSWTGRVTLVDGREISICSWDTMAFLVKYGSIVEVGEDYFIKELTAVKKSTF